MINLLVEYGREFEKVRLTEKDILNEETLNKYSNDELFNIYCYYSINDEDDPRMTRFKSHKEEFLTKNPQHNPPKQINRKQATDLIIFFIHITIKKMIFLYLMLKKTKLKYMI